MKHIGGLVVLSLLLASPSRADWKRDLKQCESQADISPDQRIQYCTSALDSGKLKVDAQAMALKFRAFAYNGKQDYDHAIQDCTQSINLNSNDAETFGIRGSAYLDKGDYDHTIQDLNEAVRLNTSDPSVFFSLAAAYSGKGDYDLAIKNYGEAIQLDPNWPEALWRRGFLWIMQGNPTAAAKDLSEAVRQKPDYSDAIMNLAWAHFLGGDFAAAQTDLSRLSIYPDPAVLLFLAHARAGQDGRGVGEQCNKDGFERLARADHQSLSRQFKCRFTVGCG